MKRPFCLLPLFLLAATLAASQPAEPTGDSHEATGAAVTPSPTGASTAAPKTRINPKDGLEYVGIPPGTFEMGCAPGDLRCDFAEKPRHMVTLSGFWIGRTEVTVGAYRRSGLGAASTKLKVPKFPQDDTHPMVHMSWDDARAFCEWSGGRLPTEAEWEYAARGGSESIYPWGDYISPERAHYGSRGTSSVAQFAANGFGLHDMVGNVFEWVGDWWDMNCYNKRVRKSQPAVRDPKGPEKGHLRVARGGSFRDNDPGQPSPMTLRLSARVAVPPGERVDFIGFRCVQDAP